MTPKVTLNRQDMHASYVMGTDTVAVCKLMGFQPREEIMGGKNRSEQNIEGYKAEFAVARYLQIDPPIMSWVTDYGVDLWYGDTAIDVKCSVKDELIFDKFSSFKADAAILCAVRDSNVVELRGWVSVADFEARAKDHDYGYGPRKIVSVGDLNPMDSFDNWANQNNLKT